jgi:hypothetical protein
VGTILLCIVLAVIAVVSPAAADQVPATDAIVLRVYNAYGLSTSDLGTARIVVRQVFRAAGIQTIWRDCSGNRHESCSERLTANEIFVRLIRSPNDPRVSSSDHTLGVSLIQSELGYGSYTSVYPDRVDAIADRFGSERNLVLGRAIAHELGHVLLGMTQHPAAGLMRAHWSERPLQASVPGDWIFSSVEAQQLRDATRARATGHKPAARIAAHTPAASPALAH